MDWLQLLPTPIYDAHMVCEYSQTWAHPSQEPQAESC